MPSNKKPRKAYRPRPVRLDTMGYVKESITPLTEFVAANLGVRLQYRSSLDAISKGHGTAVDIGNLIDASNMAMSLKKLGNGEEWSDVLLAGADAVEQMRNRYNTTGAATLWAWELHDIRALLNVHDDQLDRADLRALEQGIKITQKRKEVMV